MSGRPIGSVCVFCGSRSGVDPAFPRVAEAFGRLLAEHGITVVYGGAKIGLMGALAKGALEAGGRVVGVIPKGLVSKEVAHDGLTELYLTDTMHDRKNRMIALSDAFVALPGGFGTYDEFFETLTLAQIGFHDRPNGLLNVGGFFDPFLALLDHTIATGFASREHEALVVQDEDPGRLLQKLIAWAPPELGLKWKSIVPPAPVEGT